MNYEQFFADQISALKGEGRYRVFADLERQVGAFPTATSHNAHGTEEVRFGVQMTTWNGPK